MASGQLAVVRANDRLEPWEDAYVEEEVREDECGRDDEATERDDLLADVDNLKADKEGLEEQVELLRGLVEVSDAAHQSTKGRLASAEEALGLARETATLWEDLFHGAEAQGSATGLVVGITVTVAGAAGYLLALAQLGTFLR